MDRLVALRGNGAERDLAVEDPLEEVRLVAARPSAPPRSRRGPSPSTRRAASGCGTRRRSRAAGGCGRARRRCARSPRASRRPAAGTGRGAASSRGAPSGPPPLWYRAIEAEHLDLVRGEARQIAVRDQVVGVALVLRVSDVAADVVQERAVLQPLALGRRELVERRASWSKISSASRATWAACSTSALPRRSSRSIERARTSRSSTRFCPCRATWSRRIPSRRPRSPTTIALAPVRFRIQASRIPPGTAMSRRRGSRPGTRSFSRAVVRRSRRLTFRSPSRVSVRWPVGRRLAPENRRLVDERERLDRARGADAGLEARLADGDGLAWRPRGSPSSSPCGRARSADRSRSTGRPEPDDAERKALGQVDARALGDDELRRAAADVDQEERIETRRELAAHAEVDEPRLLLARDDVDRDAGAPADGLEEVAEFEASRTAQVATARTSSAPAAWIERRNCSTASTPASMASSERRPVASVSLPRRTRDFSRDSTCSDPSSSTEAISSLMLLVPMSMAASCLIVGAILRPGEDRPEGDVNSA